MAKALLRGRIRVQNHRWWTMEEVQVNVRVTHMDLSMNRNDNRCRSQNQFMLNCDTHKALPAAFRRRQATVLRGRRSLDRDCNLIEYAMKSVPLFLLLVTMRPEIYNCYCRRSFSDLIIFVFIR